MYCLNVYRLGRLPRIALVAAGLALGSWGAQAQDTVKIGFLGPLSGGDAEQGISARNGFQLAVDQANHADLPFKIEPVILDDAANPQTGVAAALKLTNDPEVVAATGHWNSGVALATIPVFSRANIPLIVWGAISPKITEKSNTNAPLAKWAAAQLGKKIAIVSDTTDYGLANVKSFDKFFTEAGGAIVATETAPVGTTDFRTVLTKIKAGAPDAIYFGGVVTEAGLVRSQMSELGMKQPMIGVDGFYDPEFIKIAGPAADGTISGIIKEEGNAKLTKLTADYNAAKFSEPMGPYTKNAYDATNIIIAALKQAGLKDRAAIAKAIRDTQYDGTLGHTSFDSNGQTTLPVELELREVKGGVWVAH
jgi:branched-chain amino acid transport system substrate-binding protein